MALLQHLLYMLINEGQTLMLKTLTKESHPSGEREGKHVFGGNAWQCATDHKGRVPDLRFHFEQKHTQQYTRTLTQPRAAHKHATQRLRKAQWSGT